MQLRQLGMHAGGWAVFFRKKVKVGLSNNLTDAMTRISTRNLGIRSFLNLGSGAGDDIGFYLRYWPEMASLMVEMDPRFVESFQSLQAEFPRLNYVTCAVGPQDGYGYFSKSNSVGGVLNITADRTEVPRGASAVRVATVDALVSEYKLEPPYFLKFDTHGVEVDILAGAGETLRDTALIIMEAYNFRLDFTGGRNLTFDEMIPHMRSLGFRCVDFIDPLYRPKNQVLWQAHLAFQRDDHPIWKSNSYRG